MGRSYLAVPYSPKTSSKSKLYARLKSYMTDISFEQSGNIRRFYLGRDTRFRVGRTTYTFAKNQSVGVSTYRNRPYLRNGVLTKPVQKVKVRGRVLPVRGVKGAGYRYNRSIRFDHKGTIASCYVGKGAKIKVQGQTVALKGDSILTYLRGKLYRFQLGRAAVLKYKGKKTKIPGGKRVYLNTRNGEVRRIY